MKAAIYLRVSTEEQAKGYSIPTQLEHCREKAKQLGADVAPDMVFNDEGFSGSSPDRPGLAALREAVAVCAVDVVVVYDADRLSRRLVDLLLIEDEFRAKRVQLHFVKSQYDQSDEGNLFFQIRGAFAEFERRKIIERTQRGKRGRAQAGFPLGGRPPYGYRYEPDGHHRGHYVVDDAQAMVVKLIYRWCLDGKAISKITHDLSVQKIPAKLGGMQWSGSSVHRILTYEGYTGEGHYNKTQKVAPKKSAAQHPQKCTAVPRPSEEWIPIRLPEIVDRVTYEAAQRRLGLNASLAQRNSSREYLLKGRVFCGFCGAAMVGSATHDRRFYRCTHRHSSLVEKCRAGLLHADNAETAVWAEVFGILNNPEILAEEASQRAAGVAQKSKLFEHELKILDGVVLDCDRKQNNLLDLYLADGIDVPLFKQRSEDLRSRKERAVARRAELEGLMAGKAQEAKALASLEWYMVELKRKLGAMTFLDRQLALAALDIRLVWTGKVLELTGVVPTGTMSENAVASTPWSWLARPAVARPSWHARCRPSCPR